MNAVPAAYHGVGWRPRTRTLHLDLAEGELWRTAGTDSEWATLRAVMLAVPPPEWPAPSDWNDVQYLMPVDFAVLRGELLAYGDTLRRLGIDVLVEELNVTGPRGPAYNGCFVRDQFFMTPEGAIVARMGSTPRSGEERIASTALAVAGVPILRTVGADGCFEGADALWVRPDVVLVGIGNRTNDSGARQVTAVLSELGATVLPVRMPRRVQHLLGLLQLVGPDLGVVRVDMAPPTLLGLLKELGIETLPLPECEAVTTGQAMNFVVVGDRRVVMVDGWPQIRAELERNGVAVSATVPCGQLSRAAGGLACATGIIHRTRDAG